MSPSTDYDRGNRTNETTREYADDSQKDPATLEREIDQTRAQMDRTLGALERKLSPGQMLDEALGLVKEHGGEFVSNLNDSIKHNPMPVLLTAVGVGWMMMSSNRPSTSAGYSYNRYEPLDANDRSVTSSLGSAQESAREKLGDAGERIRAGTDATRQKLNESREAVAAGLGRTTDAAQAQARRARQGFNHLLEEQPLILGALGIALGAAIGAALPTTEQENRVLGPARDRALSNIQEQGAQAYEKVKDTAAQAGEQAKQSVSEAARQTPEGERREQQSPSKRTELG